MPSSRGAYAALPGALGREIPSQEHSANLAGPGLWPSVWGNLIFLANNAEPQTLPQGFCPPTACGVEGWSSGEGTRQTGMPCWSKVDSTQAAGQAPSS